MTQDVWASGEAYEAYVGRWSRRVAEAFLQWLERLWTDAGLDQVTVQAIDVPTRFANFEDY